MQRGQRLHLSDMHWPLLAVVVLICLLGIYNLHSAAAARDPSLYLRQLYWMLAGGGLIVVLLLGDYRITEGLAYPAYGMVLLLLVAVLVQGKIAKGAERWLELGPINLQPSELAKLALVLCLARYFSQRQEAGGYTMGTLFRPLNPSRPLAAVGALAVFWSKPWLVDPLGELARFIHKKLGANVPPPDDLLWFRSALLLLIVVGVVVGIVGLVRYERRVALLNPWPPKRRNRLIALLVVVALALVGCVVWWWNAPVVSDPFGVAIAELAQAGSPGGRYATLSPRLALRLVLVLAAGLFVVASLFNLRRPVANAIDLVIAPIDLIVLPFLLVLVQPDLGTAGVVFLVGMTIVLVVGVRVRTLAILGVMGAAIAAVGWFGILKDYQKSRILTFLDPEHDVQGAGWNAVQSMIAVGSGRWFGKGHMGGTQTQLSFLPETHTDFAFSVWAEEQGFIGTLLIVALYFLLLAIALSIAADARDRYGALLATGCTAVILWQTVINISMVVGSFPVVGMTLPLFSYGGSSVVTVLLCVGLLLNVHWRRRVH